jgi:hypothetical protein
MKRVDDGSQEWFDQMAKSRIRGSNDGFSQYSKYIPNLTTEINIDSVSDPVLKEKLLAAKQAGIQARERNAHRPHFGPLHLGEHLGEKKLDQYSAANVPIPIKTDMNTIAGTYNAMHSRIAQQTNEVDSVDMQLARMPPHMRGQAIQKLQMLQNGKPAFNANLARLNEVGNANMQMNHPQQSQFSVQSCRLLEGHPCFRALQTNSFGTTTPLVRAIGQIVPQVSMHEFVVKGLVKVFVVPPQMQQINLATIQNNPQLVVELVEVMAPPMSGIGTILVPREALGMAGGMGNQRGLLTDSVQRPHQQVITNNRQVQRPAFLPNSLNTPQGKGILKG